jgi:hypothetical protein
MVPNVDQNIYQLLNKTNVKNFIGFVGCRYSQ